MHVMKKEQKKLVCYLILHKGEKPKIRCTKIMLSFVYLVSSSFTWTINDSLSLSTSTTHSFRDQYLRQKYGYSEKS